MTDLISRQQAIDTLCKSECGWNNAECRHKDDTDFCVTCDNVKIIKSLPSVQPETNCSEIPNNSDTISRQAVTKFLNDWLSCLFENCHKQSASDLKMIIKDFKNLPSAQSERKTGHWILDRSGAYCCDNCMEPCAGYIMMKPRDRYCKMCGAKMEGGE